LFGAVKQSTTEHKFRANAGNPKRPATNALWQPAPTAYGESIARSNARGAARGKAAAKLRGATEI